MNIISESYRDHQDTLQLSPTPLLFGFGLVAILEGCTHRHEGEKPPRAAAHCSVKGLLLLSSPVHLPASSTLNPLWIRISASREATRSEVAHFEHHQVKELPRSTCKLTLHACFLCHSNFRSYLASRNVSQIIIRNVPPGGLQCCGATPLRIACERSLP